MGVRPITIASAIAAPIVGGDVAALATLLWDSIVNGATGDIALGLLGAIGVGMFGGFIFGLPAMLLIGLPTHALLVRVGRSELFPYALLGAANTAIAMTIFGLPGFSSPLASVVGEQLADHFTFHGVFGAVAGSATAASFWLIRRPDRDAPANPPTPTP